MRTGHRKDDRMDLNEEMGEIIIIIIIINKNNSMHKTGRYISAHNVKTQLSNS